MIATDLDRTLIWEDNVVRARTLAALARAEEEGLRVVVVTGRMVQSARRVLEGVPLADGMVCYQGAVVTDGDGGWIHHQPIEVDLARDAIAAIEESGFTLNAYVGDELYVAEATEWVERYAGFQQLHVNAVGRLSTWIAEPPTKLVCVGEPAELDAFAVQMRARYGDRLWISKSFPHFLEFADAGVSKGSGLDHLAERLGFSPEVTVAFGDAENDVELIEWAGFGVAVGNAHPTITGLADWVCPPAADEGVAQVIEAVLDRRSAL